MAMLKENLDQALAGVMATERQIIALAESKGLPGLRCEWNDDIDFGHLQDPMPTLRWRNSRNLRAARLEEIVDALTDAA